MSVALVLVGGILADDPGHSAVVDGVC